MSHNVKHSYGFVLIVVLIYLQLFSIFSLYALENSLIASKQSKNTLEQNRLFIAAERVLRFAENKLMSESPNCFIPITSVNDLLNKPVDWWQQTGCKGSIHERSYYYIIELLEDNPCAVADNYQSSYYRISVLLTTGDDDNNIRLQSTVIKPTKIDMVCNEKIYQVTPGRQMWREL